MIQCTKTFWKDPNNKVTELVSYGTKELLLEDAYDEMLGEGGDGWVWVTVNSQLGDFVTIFERLYPDMKKNVVDEKTTIFQRDQESVTFSSDLCNCKDKWGWYECIIELIVLQYVQTPVSKES